MADIGCFVVSLLGAHRRGALQEAPVWGRLRGPHPGNRMCHLRCPTLFHHLRHLHQFAIYELARLTFHTIIAAFGIATILHYLCALRPRRRRLHLRASDVFEDVQAATNNWRLCGPPTTTQRFVMPTTMRPGLLLDPPLAASPHELALDGYGNSGCNQRTDVLPTNEGMNLRHAPSRQRGCSPCRSGAARGVVGGARAPVGRCSREARAPLGTHRKNPELSLAVSLLRDSVARRGRAWPHDVSPAPPEGADFRRKLCKRGRGVSTMEVARKVEHSRRGLLPRRVAPPLHVQVHRGAICIGKRPRGVDWDTTPRRLRAMCPRDVRGATPRCTWNGHRSDDQHMHIGRFQTPARPAARAAPGLFEAVARLLSGADLLHQLGEGRLHGAELNHRLARLGGRSVLRAGWQQQWPATARASATPCGCVRAAGPPARRRRARAVCTPRTRARRPKAARRARRLGCISLPPPPLCLVGEVPPVRRTGNSHAEGSGPSWRRTDGQSRSRNTETCTKTRAEQRLTAGVAKEDPTSARRLTLRREGRRTETRDMLDKCTSISRVSLFELPAPAADFDQVLQHNAAKLAQTRPIQLWPAARPAERGQCMTIFFATPAARRKSMCST